MLANILLAGYGTGVGIFTLIFTERMREEGYEDILPYFMFTLFWPLFFLAAIVCYVYCELTVPEILDDSE